MWLVRLQRRRWQRCLVSLWRQSYRWGTGGSGTGLLCQVLGNRRLQKEWRLLQLHRLCLLLLRLLLLQWLLRLLLHRLLQWLLRLLLHRLRLLLHRLRLLLHWLLHRLLLQWLLLLHRLLGGWRRGAGRAECAADGTLYVCLRRF